MTIIGSLIGMQLDTLADQSFSIGSSNWIASGIFITNISGTGQSAQVAIYDAPGGGGANVVASTGGVLNSIVGTSDAQMLSASGIASTGKGKVRAAGTYYARAKTLWPAGTTGDLYVVGVEI